MKIGIISDTHGHVNFATQGVRALREQDVEQVIHCGDIGSTTIIELFDGLSTHFVFGNVDWDQDGLKDEIAACGQTCHDEMGTASWAGREIAFLHSHDRNRYLETIQSQKYDLVCYGHTHKAEKHRDGKTLVLNPGALYRTSVRSVAVVDLETMEAEHIEV
ncbi:MAG: YfcE family phosphodiesterase [Planctomycetaceae bacterium]|nr:YfcE family phosphodiesterase [Planctomycetaceae bacterium]